jgi:hypothetical protein
LLPDPCRILATPLMRGAVTLLLGLSLAGCAAVAQRATDRLAADLGRAVLDHDDPESVRDGLPAYLLLLDALVQGDPENAATLHAAAGLYASYAGSFVDDPARAARLATRARDYSRRATCLDLAALCAQLDRPFEEFGRALAATPQARTVELYGLAGAWATWIQTHSDDYAAIADIPKVEALLQRVVAQSPDHDRGMAWVYLGVLGSLRPEAVGGRPEQGRKAFERALEISAGRNLMAKTLFARHYARLVFDQELHDRLLREVLAADAHAPGFTLANVLAQRQAQELLRTSPDYF